MVKVMYKIPNISCHHCVQTIQSELLEINGVKTVVPNLDSKTVEVTFENPASEEKIKNLLKEIEYPVAE